MIASEKCAGGLPGREEVVIRKKGFTYVNRSKDNLCLKQDESSRTA